MPRFHVLADLAGGFPLDLPPGPSRHAQVLRLQPGSELSVFNAGQGEWSATVERMGRQSVQVRLGERLAPPPVVDLPVTLAVGMPANERMDWLVEKAAELGVAAIVPLMCERAVLRLHGERAQRKVQHWQAIAVAACEQCGRIDVPEVAPVQALADWLQGPVPADLAARRWLLSAPAALPPAEPFDAVCAGPPGIFLSGPEGGLTPAEQAAAVTAGWRPVSLGPRVLRADTAPIAALAALQLKG